MAKRAAAVLVRTVCASNDELTGLSDCDLIRRYAEFEDQAAFAALVQRHSGMVLGVCKRVLNSQADAEDAYQAVFLVLAKKVKANRWQRSVANWLYATARKVAGNARIAAARRSKREGAAAVPERVPPFDAMSARDLAAALDEELDKLPPRYREPLVLCYLEGLTRDEAATRLGVAATTLKSQLERGRKKLADALTARGCALGVALLATAATSGAKAPSPRLDSILAGAGGAPSEAVAVLAQGIAMNGVLTRTKLQLVIGVMVLGFGVAAMPITADTPRPAADKMEKPKTDARAEPQKPEAKEHIITGKVVDPDGKPRQAELHLFWFRGKAEALGKTNADGTFKVTVPLVEPLVFLGAKADGFGFDFLTLAGNSPADVTFKLTKDVPIRARIVDGAGKPVAGATVKLESVQTFADDSIQAFLDAWKKRTYFREHPVDAKSWCQHAEGGPFRATTDRDGRFELAGIGAERLASLEIKAPGREDAEVYVITRAGFDPKPFNEVTLSLKPKTGEKLTWDFNPIFSAPDFTLALEAEKPVRGRVTDAKTGKPRAGVEVRAGSDNGVTRSSHRATTDADGRYELHGAKKLPTYTVNIPGDPETGYLPARVEVNDTVGHEPVVADIACQKGVVVTGIVRNKATGKPVPDARLRVHVLAGNTFAKQYPSLGKYSTLKDGTSKPDGTYRVLVIPGPVLLTCGAGGYGVGTLYGPPRADPDYPNLFADARDGGGIEYFTVGGGQGMVDGNWCKVIDAKGTDTDVKRDIELVPVVKKAVRVVDADGKPARNVHATGFTRRPWHYAEQVGDTDAIPVFDLKPKEKRLVVARDPGRKQVGAAEIDESDPAPLMKLGPGGTAKGRVVDRDGKPMAGVTVKLYFDRREVAEIYGALNENRKAVTGADGTFEFDALLPGYDFRFQFLVGRKAFRPDYREAPTHRIEKHSDTLKIGDIKLEPAKVDGEE